MKKSLRERLEAMGAALAFAEGGDFGTARVIMGEAGMGPRQDKRSGQTQRRDSRPRPQARF
jgi:hypothetical protein